jgi:hypothetical protein
MKELIQKALAEAIVKLNKQRPTTKKKGVLVPLDVDSPRDIPKFMDDNNIPDDACLTSYDDSMPLSSSCICLYYDIDVPTVEKDDMEFNRKRFSNIAWNILYPLMLQNGYQRVGFNSGLLRDFKDTTVYDMYIAEDFDKIILLF